MTKFHEKLEEKNTGEHQGEQVLGDKLLLASQSQKSKQMLNQTMLESDAEKLHVKTSLRQLSKGQLRD